MNKKEQIPAYLEMDERDTTERILHNMTDSEAIAKRERHKAEVKRVDVISKRLSL